MTSFKKRSRLIVEFLFSIGAIKLLTERQQKTESSDRVDGRVKGVRLNKSRKVEHREIGGNAPRGRKRRKKKK